MKKQIIAFCGPKYAGKSLAAQALCERAGFQETSFATPLKDTCAQLFGVPRKFFSTPELKEAPLTDFGWPGETPRTIMQVFGTDLMRSRWPDIWIRAWENSIWNIDRVVVSDLRFVNEAEKIKSLGGYVIRVNRPSLSNTDRHESETAFMDITPDAELTNVGDKALFQDAVFKIYLSLFPLVNA